MVYRLVQGAVWGILTVHQNKVNETIDDLHAPGGMRAAMRVQLASGLRDARNRDSPTLWGERPASDGHRKWQNDD